MKRATILLLAHRIPFPPDKGDKIRSYHWLAHLAARHDVFCACFVDDRADWAHVAALRERCRDVAAIPLTRTTKWRRAAVGLGRGMLRGGMESLTQAVYADGAMQTTVERWRRVIDFDAVLAFSGAMAPYALAARARRRVLDLCDCDSAKWHDYAARQGGPAARLLQREGARLAAAEHAWLDQFDSICVVHERERRLLDPQGTSSRLHVIINGVDPPTPAPTPQRPIVTFVGALDYAANVDGLDWFVREVWPLVRRSCPQAEFRMVGRAPGRAVQRLAGAPGVRLVGEVPEVAPWLRDTRVCVAPLRIARGVQNKVLEGMAQGRAVVATSAAAAGVDAIADEHLLVADGAEDFAARVAALLKDWARCERIGGAARRHAVGHYDWAGPTAAMEREVLGAAWVEARGGPVEQLVVSR